MNSIRLSREEFENLESVPLYRPNQFKQGNLRLVVVNQGGLRNLLEDEYEKRLRELGDPGSSADTDVTD